MEEHCYVPPHIQNINIDAKLHEKIRDNLKNTTDKKVNRFINHKVKYNSKLLVVFANEMGIIHKNFNELKGGEHFVIAPRKYEPTQEINDRFRDSKLHSTMKNIHNQSILLVTCIPVKNPQLYINHKLLPYFTWSNEIAEHLGLTNGLSSVLTNRLNIISSYKHGKITLINGLVSLKNEISHLYKPNKYIYVACIVHLLLSSDYNVLPLQPIRNKLGVFEYTNTAANMLSASNFYFWIVYNNNLNIVLGLFF